MSNHLLKDYTTLKVGGEAAYFFGVTNEDEVIDAAKFAKEKALPILVLGGGSNLLVDDTGFPGVVIYNQIKGVVVDEGREDEVILRVGGGEVLDEVVEYTVNQGWWGIENLTSIPGTVGATPVQNVGAYGVEIGEVIAEVEVIDMRSGEKKKIKKVDCNFGYRDSLFKSSEGKNYFITHVCISLSKKSKPKIDYADLKKIFLEKIPTQLEIRKALIEVRAGKFPDWHVVGTAGSFFKNPIITSELKDELMLQYEGLPTYPTEDGMFKISLGYVLDKVCGLRGYREGAVGLSEAQALVLINYGGATAAEIKNFVYEISKKVFEKTKIKISPEVNFV